MAKKNEAGTPETTTGEQPKSAMPNNMAILEQLRREITSEIKKEIQGDTPRDEFNELKGLIEKQDAIIKDLKEQNLKMDARTSNFNRDLTPYPTKKRSVGVSFLEKMFDELGVGQKTMRFIRKNYTGELLLPSSSKLSRDNELIRLMYCTNHESPFVDDHPDSPHWIPETEPIRFNSTGDMSAIDVPPSNSCLQRYLLSHPGNGRLFYLEDREQLAKEQNAREDAIFDALLEFEKYLHDESFNLGIFAVHAIRTQQPLIDSVRLSREELKREIRSSLKTNPELIKTFSKDMVDCQLRFLYQKCLDEGLLTVTSNEIRTAWNNERIAVIKSVADYDFVRVMKTRKDVVEILKEKSKVSF